MFEQFSIEEVDSNIYLIKEPWFVEHANAYLFKGNNSCLLFDCGIGIFDMKEFLLKRGFKNIKVILTHSHFDHAGGIKHFLPEDVMILPNIFKNIKNRRMWALEYLRPSDIDAETLAQFGLPDAKYLCGHYDFSLKGIGFFATKFPRIELPPFSFEVVATPGH